MNDEPRFDRGPWPPPLSSEQADFLRAFAEDNPEVVKQYAETFVNPDFYRSVPAYKVVPSLACTFCGQPITAIEDKPDPDCPGTTVYVAEPCLCSLTKHEFELIRAQMRSWQDYLDDPNSDAPMGTLDWHLPKSPWWARVWRWLTGWWR